MPRISAVPRALAIAGVLLGAVATTASGAEPNRLWAVRGSFEPTAARLIYTSARSLGMLRGLTEEDAFVRLRFKGSGTISAVTRTGSRPAVKLDNYYVQLSYPDAGMLIDTTTGGIRRVNTVLGGVAWDERDIDADGPPAGKSQVLAPQSVKERRLELATTPHGAIKAAHAAVGQVKVTPLAHNTFMLSFPYEGDTMQVTLDRNRRPAKVEIGFNHPVVGRTVLTREYSDYKDFEPINDRSDEPLSDLYFPSHIVQKVGGHTTLDVRVDTCWCVNPYVVFIPPSQR